MHSATPLFLEIRKILCLFAGKEKISRQQKECCHTLWKQYIHNIAKIEKKASEALFKGEQYFMADNYEFALNGDSLGFKGFLNVANEFGGTDAGKLANAYAGICYAQLGQYENAVKFLDKFNANDQLVSPALMATMGNCYVQMGQLDKGAATLVKAADKANSHSLSPIYLIQAGQVYEKLGKNSEAVNAYQTIKDKYFNSYQAMDIDKYIERASAK